MNVRLMTYTKDSGEATNREVLVVSSPRDNYLTYDVSDLSDDHLEVLLEALTIADDCRENALKDFELITGIKVNSLWRSFKPGGVDWKE